MFPYHSHCDAAFDDAELDDEEQLADEVDLSETVADDDTSTVLKWLSMAAFAAQINPMKRGGGGAPAGAARTGKPALAAKPQTANNGKKANGNVVKLADKYSPEMWIRIGREYNSVPKGEQQWVARKYGLNGTQIRKMLARMTKQDRTPNGASTTKPSIFDYIVGVVKRGNSSDNR